MPERRAVDVRGSSDLDDFVVAHQHDSDHALLLASLEEMEGGTAGLSSLEIHASLEVMTRYLLLPYVDSRRRPYARRNLAKAAWDFADVATPPASGADDIADRVSDEDLAVAPWPTVGRVLDEALCQPRSRNALTTRILEQVGGAGHGQILLHHVLDSDLHVRRKLLPHMQMFIRAFCEDPSTEGGAVIPQLRPLLRASPDAIDDFLSAIPRSTVDTPHTGIRGVMARGQGVEIAEIDSTAGRTSRTPFDAAGTACIAAARMMLTAETDLEYGWSHCLTLSEAAWGFVDHGEDAGAIVALSYVTGFVAALGFPGWPSLASAASTQTTGVAAFRQALASPSPEDAVAICLGAERSFAMEAWGEIVSQASTLEDAHLVKYVYACLKCASRKPEAEPVFLASATRLLARWLSR